MKLRLKLSTEQCNRIEISYQCSDVSSQADASYQDGMAWVGEVLPCVMSNVHDTTLNATAAFVKAAVTHVS